MKTEKDDIMCTALKKILRDGSCLEIHKFIFPGCSDVPDWGLPFFQMDLPECWRLYYDEVFNDPADDIVNYCYAGVIGGVPCCRMWFGFSRKTGAGNFGNVVTLPEFRRRGIMMELLNELCRDFEESGAFFCSCDAADAAAGAYEKAGFYRIFGEEYPPMALVRSGSGSFSSIIAAAYGNTGNAKIRPGVRSDRFDCDKLLMYAPQVYRKISLPQDVPSYLSLWQEYVRRGMAEVRVLEAESGFCAGFAFKLEDGRSGCVLHPGFKSYEAQLLKEVSGS